MQRLEYSLLLSWNKLQVEESLLRRTLQRPVAVKIFLHWTTNPQGEAVMLQEIQEQSFLDGFAVGELTGQLKHQAPAQLKM